jgi:hypothetical protein
MTGPVSPKVPVHGEVASQAVLAEPAIFDNPPDDGPPPPPDLIVQIRDSSGPDPPCLTDTLRAVIQESIQSSFATLFSGVYVDNACVGGPEPANEAAAFGVWLTTPSNLSAAHQLLDMSIGRAPNETIAFYISATLFDAVATQVPPQDPPGGSIHLHPPARLEFQSPDAIITIIDGVDEEPTPDVSFTLTIQETFSGGPRQTPPWYVPTQSLDVDTTWVDILAAALTIPLFAPGFAPLSFAGWCQAWEANTATAPSEQGYGSSVASLVMPLDIPIPGGLKYPIQYALREDHNAGIQVDTGGMYVGGFLLQPVSREPSVSLTGEKQISLHVGGPDVEDTIQASPPKDMRGNLAYAWTVNGGPVSPNSDSAGSSITLLFDPSAGPFQPQNVALTVTDADALTAEASMQVTASVQQPGGVGKGSGNPCNPRDLSPCPGRISRARSAAMRRRADDRAHSGKGRLGRDPCHIPRLTPRAPHAPGEEGEERNAEHIRVALNAIDSALLVDHGTPPPGGHRHDLESRTDRMARAHCRRLPRPHRAGAPERNAVYAR